MVTPLDANVTLPVLAATLLELQMSFIISKCSDIQVLWCESSSSCHSLGSPPVSSPLQTVGKGADVLSFLCDLPVLSVHGVILDLVCYSLGLWAMSFSVAWLIYGYCKICSSMCCSLVFIQLMLSKLSSELLCTFESHEPFGFWQQKGQVYIHKWPATVLCLQSSGM